ncbi:MAG TPA: MotA/TolQ/ExbB proton channel family protein [Gemmataceae bacterium]|nr:MotA/TolQ/ExbB proton channel family protein [Gemmataceae bacterium]
MSRKVPTIAPQPRAAGERRSGTTWAAFVVGVPLAALVLAAIHHGLLHGTDAERYVKHNVECVEVLLFCCAISALGAKLWTCRAERAACRAEVLPAWDGKPRPAAEASRLLAAVDGLPRRLQGTFLVRRISAVLSFLCSRGSANELDDHLRALADNDALALEGSYALTRFITWAIPILGFLGTVLGITKAISGVTPEVLEKSLSSVTDGLALAFDTTALGLALTMITMFLSFVVERSEQGVLDAVDLYADQELAHRFERTGPEGGEFVAVVRQNTQVLLQATGDLVQRQADVWAMALDQADRRRTEAEDRQQKRLTASLEAALERTLETHARRLAALEKEVIEQSAGLVERMSALATAVRETGREQLAALVQASQGMGAQAEALQRLQDNENQLLRLQEALNHNLAALAGAGAFEDAVQSLTAAIHLVTARVGGVPLAGEAGRKLPKPGAAA